LLKSLLPLLIQFLEGNRDLLSKTDILDPKTYYYLKEIIRYWNRLNFIINRVFTEKNPAIPSQAALLYATYRIFYENIPREIIFNELSPFLTTAYKKNKILSFLKALRTFNWEQAIQGKSEEEYLSLEAAVPTFVIRKLLSVMSIEFLKQNLQFMNNLKSESTQTVRINALRANTDLVEQIKSDLINQGIEIQQDSNFPELFYIPTRKKSVIIKSNWYRSGYLIFQDKASATVASILAPQDDDLICDLCAAPGIKTSLLAQYTLNTARIFAIDVHSQRIVQMKQLLRHLHVLGVHPLNTDGLNLPFRITLQFDKVLLDAPCTGSGTFFANPELKWRQTQKFLQQNCYFQQKLLETAIQILKPGGILVYATCSLYPEEGELQILKFKDKIIPLKLPNWISPNYQIEKSLADGTGRLFPVVHHTQGFFIAKLQKVD